MKKSKILAIIFLVSAFVLSGCGKGSENSVTVEDNIEEGTVVTEEEKSDLVLTDSIKQMIDTYLVNVYDYLEKIKKDGNIVVTRYSFLFDQTNDEYIAIDLLDYLEYYKDWTEYEPIEMIDTLYVRNSDMQTIQGVTVPDNNELSIFTGLDTKDGVYISSKEYGSGYMTYEDYGEMMVKYNLMHGTIATAEEGDSAYKSIVQAITDYDKSDGEYDIKHMKYDALYAIAVFAPKEDYGNLKQYAFKRENGKWNVIFDDLAQRKDVYEVLNTAYPDYPLVILPEYNIAALDIKTDLSDIEQLMIKSNIITESDLPAVYSCGAGGYVYFEFQNNKIFVGRVNTEGELTVYPAQDATEAEAYLYEFEDMPPTYIIKRN